jgi:hypothetical protein
MSPGSSISNRLRQAIVSLLILPWSFECSNGDLMLPWSSDKVHKSLREKRHNKRFLPSSLQRIKWSCWNVSYWRNSGRTSTWGITLVTDYQTESILLYKFLTFFNCHVQPLTDNLQLIKGIQSLRLIFFYIESCQYSMFYTNCSWNFS